MKKEKVIKIFEDAMDYVPVTVLMSNSKDKVSATFKGGKVDKLIVSSKASFDDVCDALEAMYEALPKAA